MAKKNTTKKTPAKKAPAANNAFAFKYDSKASREEESLVHKLGPGIVCDTESRGHAEPQGKSRVEIVVDASEGFIPLWAKNTVLRWRFQERSMLSFKNPTAAKKEIRKLLGEALAMWGDAAPVKFKEDTDVWDFEIVMKKADSCSLFGCVLASAFFPDAGRHELTIYPKLFTQDKKEQIETLVHEIGHVFGLRHFFAKLKETKWPSEIFGKHSEFSIMNYGALSQLTEDDKNDLKQLYKAAWSKKLTHINGTAIQFVKPYHTTSQETSSALSMKEELVG